MAELEDALALGAERGLGVVVVGLGSNLLAADEGVDALVAAARRRAGGGARSADDVLVAGGGATNAVCLHRARAAGLGGFEFACAIPGTAGGGVLDERRRVRARLGGGPGAGARRRPPTAPAG